MTGKTKEYAIALEAEPLREFIRSLKEAGAFGKLWSLGFRGDSGPFYAKAADQEGTILQETYIYFFPQKDSTRIKIVNEIPEGQRGGPFLTWDVIRKELERSSIQVQDVTGFANTAVFNHRYIDPSPYNIPNPKHRKAIDLLIEAEKGPAFDPNNPDSPPRWKTQKEIAAEIGLSPSQLSWIKNEYMREEFREGKGERPNKPN